MKAGIVLAGGQSKRMGRNKALLPYQGRPMVEHMVEVLRQSGFDRVFISGQVEGYDSFADEMPYAGPATAIQTILKKKSGYEGYFFVPVDMPFLSPQIIDYLMHTDKSAYFKDRPLPLYLKPPVTPSAASSIHALLDANYIIPIDMPKAFEAMMTNTNTPQEWQEALKRHEC